MTPQELVTTIGLSVFEVFFIIVGAVIAVYNAKEQGDYEACERREDCNVRVMQSMALRHKRLKVFGLVVLTIACSCSIVHNFF